MKSNPSVTTAHVSFFAAVADRFAEPGPGGRERGRRQNNSEDEGKGNQFLSSLLLRMCVSIDPPLRRWILGFGDGARVVTPRALAREIFETIQGARERYMPRLTFEPLKMTLDRRKYPLFQAYAVAGGGTPR